MGPSASYVRHIFVLPSNRSTMGAIIKMGYLILYLPWHGMTLIWDKFVDFVYLFSYKFYICVKIKTRTNCPYTAPKTERKRDQRNLPKTETNAFLFSMQSAVSE